MAMTYTSLVAAKGTAGSLKNWVNYSLLDSATIVDEAQALIYSVLRCREMLADYVFSLDEGASYVALPAYFLDPIGRIRLTSLNTEVAHKDPGTIQAARVYTNTSGTLGTDPFTTVNGSLSVNVAFTAHGFAQDSSFNVSGATAVGGVTIAGTFPISAVVDDNTFTIDITNLGTTPTSGATGGGSAVAYVCDNIASGIPRGFAIFNERLNFDVASVQQSLARLQYYRSLPLLSSSNTTNFLTNRYPQLLRTACVTAAADFMKDDTEYQKGLTRLTALVQRIAAENDGAMRGMELEPYTP